MSQEGHRIFEVIAPPSPENVLWVAEGAAISCGDFGWENDVSPDLIHLTGYAKDGGTVWYANFLPSQVRFVSLKPASNLGPTDTAYVILSKTSPLA